MPIDLKKAPTRIAVIALIAAFSSACGSSEPGRGVETTVSSFDPEQRAVRIETAGCGFASGRTGSGVAIGDGLVVTVAHLIVRAESLVASVAGAEPEEAEVAAVDLRKDLAVLRLPSANVPDIQMSSSGAGANGRIVGGAASGTVPFEVKRVVDLTIEEVLGTDRHSRGGYEVAATAGDGDSGAGAYDEQDHLIGILFATGPDDETGWLTSSDEIEDFLGDVDSSETYALCD